MRVFALLSVLLVGPAHGQEKLLPISASVNAGQFMPRGLPALNWHGDSKRFTYVKREDNVIQVKTQSISGEVATLMTWPDLAAALTKAGAKSPSPQSLLSMAWKSDGRFEIAASGGTWSVRPEPLEVTVVAPAVEGADPVVPSPKGGHTAYVKGHDVYLLMGGKDHRRVTKGGSADLTHGVSVSRVEFGISDGLWWDPTGRRVAFYQENFKPIQPYPYVDFAPRPAARVDGRYPMAGRPGSVVRIGVHDAASSRTVWLDTDPERDQYLTNVTWHPSGESIVVAHVNRAQTRCEVVEYEASSGKRLRLLFVESDHQWVEPEHGPLFLPDGSGDFLWASYRDGHRHLWRYRGDGRLVGPVTRGAFDLDSFVRFAPDGEGFYWVTTGPNPLHKHLYYTSVDGKTQRTVTSGRGHHDVALSPDGTHALDVHTNLSLPLATDLLHVADGKVLRRVHEAKDPFEGFRRCRESFFTTNADGDGAELHGYLVLPPESAENTRYPVINYVYGGPHSQLVTDQWLSGFSRWNLWLHAMAQRGYICFMLDGRGTTNRGAEWYQTVHRKLGTLEAADQVAGLRHVLSRDDADPTRVGVTGWSYGGFMTCTLMTRQPDLYSVGVSGAPVTDWAYYETGYGERYMDTPEENPEGYKEADPGSHAAKLKGRLLVVHGTADDTVMWQSSVAFVDKCVDAGVPVDYMIYPGQLHGLRGKDFAHFIAKMTDYFETHLKGAKGR